MKEKLNYTEEELNLNPIIKIDNVEDVKNIWSILNNSNISEEQLIKIEELVKKQPISITSEPSIKFTPQMYQMIADVNELKWFFDHVIQKPAVNESYSAVFVSRHKKLTKEEQATFGLTRKESEFLATQTFRRKTFKDALYQDEENNWLFERFLQTLKRFNVDKGAYVTGTGEPLPEKTLAIIFYVNPCDDIKVMREFVTQYLDVNQAISKAMLGGKTIVDNLQSYQWFGRAETNIKHLKANCKGTKYWMDFDIDVPKWWKESKLDNQKGIYAWLEKFNQKRIEEDKEKKYKRPLFNQEMYANCDTYYQLLLGVFNQFFGKGNYVVVDTSGGYHILVKNSSINGNPNEVCTFVDCLYKYGISVDNKEEYLDENGNLKFECIVNDSQIPGLPLPGTFQYGKPVVVLNKEDFE